MMTILSHEGHLAVGLLTNAELLKKGGMEEDANVFALYSPSLQIATSVKPASGTIGQ